MRPGRFELPRPVKVTRPSTLRADCSSLPIAAETPIPSGTMDDLDLVDSAFVVTVLSRGFSLASKELAAVDRRGPLARVLAVTNIDDPGATVEVFERASHRPRVDKRYRA